MLITHTRENLNKVVVLNPKGGCGKSTIAINIATFYAARAGTPAIMDWDVDGELRDLDEIGVVDQTDP